MFMSKKKEKNVVELVATKTELVELFKTNYHRYRHWIKYILAEGKISRFRFKKDEIGYTGKLLVAHNEVERAKKVLGDYQLKNAGCVDMWW